MWKEEKKLKAIDAAVGLRLHYSVSFFSHRFKYIPCIYSGIVTCHLGPISVVIYRRLFAETVEDGNTRFFRNVDNKNKNYGKQCKILGSKNSIDKYPKIQIHNTASAGIQLPMFRCTLLPPSSGLYRPKKNLRIRMETRIKLGFGYINPEYDR